MPSRSVDDLLAGTKIKVQKWLDLCAAHEIPVFLTCTYRSEGEQAALWMQGRTKLGEVNSMRKAVGLVPITAEQNERKVTWTHKSKHIERRAADFALKQPNIYDMKIDVDKDGIPDFLEVGQIAEGCGLTWGGRWTKSPDYPHVQDDEIYGA